MTQPRRSLMNSLVRRPAPPPSAPPVEIPDGPGQVVEIHEDDTPLSTILASARILGRAARQTEYLHVSDLIGKCIRKFALVESLAMPGRAQSLMLTDELTYGQGDVIHDVIKRRAASGAPGSAWGLWECRCKTTHTTVPSTYSETEAASCPACGGPVNVYKEVAMRNEEFKITGSPDLLLYLEEYDAFHINEIKSKAPDAWKDLVRPEPDHVIQVLFYWWLMHVAGYRLTNKVSILYVTKGYVFKGQPYKEFVIDAASQMARLDIYREEAANMVRFRQTGTLPARICQHENASVAKKCEVCKACFGTNSDQPNAAPQNIDLAAALSGSSPQPRRTIPLRRSRPGG